MATASGSIQFLATPCSPDTDCRARRAAFASRQAPVAGWKLGWRASSRKINSSSCGGQGFFLLLAILVVAVLLGSALLRFARVPEPGSTSFLAVGLLSVAALLFLVGSIFEWWMAIAIPLVSMATIVMS